MNSDPNSAGYQDPASIANNENNDNTTQFSSFNIGTPTQNQMLLQQKLNSAANFLSHVQTEQPNFITNEEPEKGVFDQESEEEGDKDEEQEKDNEYMSDESLDPNNEEDFAKIAQQIQKNKLAVHFNLQSGSNHKVNSMKSKTPRRAEVVENVPADDLRTLIRSKEDLMRKFTFGKQFFLPPSKACPLEFLRDIMAGTKKVRSHNNCYRL